MANRRRRIVEGRGIQFDRCALGHEERFDAAGIQHTAHDLGLTGHQQDHVTHSDIQLAGAMILQTAEAGVGAVAVPDLDGHTSEPAIPQLCRHRKRL